MVQAGKHVAKINDWIVEENAKGNPVVKVWFDVPGQGSVRWDGFLTDKTIDKTLEQLAFCGLTGPLETLADGKNGGALDTTKELAITVEHKPDQKDPSKKWANVRWINLVGGAKFDASKVASAKDKLKAFSGKWAQVKQEQGVKPKQTLEF